MSLDVGDMHLQKFARVNFRIFPKNRRYNNLKKIRLLIKKLDSDINKIITASSQTNYND